MPDDEATAPHPAQCRDGPVARPVRSDDGGVGAELSCQRLRVVVGGKAPPSAAIRHASWRVVRRSHKGAWQVIRVLGSEGDRIPSPGAGWEQSTPESSAEAGASQRTFFNRQGFRFDYFGDEKNPILQLACPYWFIMLLTAILPGARLAGWRRRARRLRMRPGLCQHCGYDCRATPDRCPECGRVSGGP